MFSFSNKMLKQMKFLMEKVDEIPRIFNENKAYANWPFWLMQMNERMRT